MATLTTLTTNVASELGLNATDDQTQIWRRLNEAVRDVLRKTHVYVAGSTTLSLTGGDIQLPATVMAITQAYVTGEAQLLEPVGAAEVLRRRLSGGSSGTPTQYGVQGWNLLQLYPTPASGTITYYYVPVPTEMSSGSHDPSTTTYGGVPAQYHEALELYALWKLASMRDDNSSSQGERYKVLYEGAEGRGGVLAEIRSDLRRMGGAKLAPARIGRSRYTSASRGADESAW